MILIQTDNSSYFLSSLLPPFSMRKDGSNYLPQDGRPDSPVYSLQLSRISIMISVAPAVIKNV